MITMSKIIFSVLILLTVMTQDSKSQSMTLCKQMENATPSIFLNSPTNSSSLNGGVSISNTYLEINAQLTIDANFTMSQCTIKFGPYASITVLQGVVFNCENTKMFSCPPYMWSGVTCFQASIINMSGCNIEDALNAIDCYGFKIKLNLSNNIFNRNEVGINCQPSQFSPNLGIASFPIFTNNTFKCSQKLNNGKDRPFAGVKIKNGSVSIGKNIKNDFENQENGILAENALLIVSKCIFKKNQHGIHVINSYLVNSGFGKDLGIKSFEENKYGIKCVRSSIECTQSYFHNQYQYGITVEGGSTTADVNIYQNRFYLDNLVASSPMNVPTTSQIAIFTPKIIGQGFSASSVNSIKITGNKFDILPQTFQTYGVFIPGNAVVASAYEILNNQTNMDGGFEMYEIYGTYSAAPLKFINNDATCVGRSNGPFHLHNFNRDGGEDINANIIEDCEINGIQVEGLARPWGFRAENCKLNWCENAVDGMETGALFVGDDDGTIFSTMHFGSNLKTGLSLSSNAMMGLQDRRSNTWPDATPSNYLSANCNGDPLLSPFFADYTIFGHDPKNPVPAFGWFSNFSGQNNCVLPPPGFVGNDGSLLNGVINESNTNPMIIWQLRRDLVNKLYWHPELRPSGSIVNTFYQQYQAHRIGQFAEARRAKDLALTVPNTQQTTLFNQLTQIKLKLGQLQLLDSLIYDQPSNISLQNERDVVIFDLNTLYVQSALMETNIKNDRNNGLSYALSLFQVINPTDPWEYNEKNLAIAELQGLLRDSFYRTEQEWNILRSIAGDCVETGGYCVLVARGLLPFDEYLAYKLQEVEPACPEGRQLLKNNHQIAIEIAPNPCSDFFTVNLPDNQQEYNLIVSDITGRTVMNQKILPETRYTNINVKNWMSGIYNVSINNELGDYIYNKLIVHH